MSDFALRIATWILSRFVSKNDREALIGDLAEEYARRVRSDSRSAAFVWYLRHSFTSIPALVRVKLTRARWPLTLGVALLAYLLVGVAQLIIRWALQSLSARSHPLLILIILVPIILLIAYLAERLRRKSAIMLGAILMIAIAAMTMWSSRNAAMQYQLAYLLVGPCVAFFGTALNWRNRGTP
jgi:hypothetical protein